MLIQSIVVCISERCKKATFCSCGKAKEVLKDFLVQKFVDFRWEGIIYEAAPRRLSWLNEKAHIQKGSVVMLLEVYNEMVQSRQKIA
jgi:hypothetical protein